MRECRICASNASTLSLVRPAGARTRPCRQWRSEDLGTCLMEQVLVLRTRGRSETVANNANSADCGRVFASADASGGEGESRGNRDGWLNRGVVACLRGESVPCGFPSDRAADNRSQSGASWLAFPTDPHPLIMLSDGSTRSCTRRLVPSATREAHLNLPAVLLDITQGRQERGQESQGRN